LGRYVRSGLKNAQRRLVYCDTSVLIKTIFKEPGSESAWQVWSTGETLVGSRIVQAESAAAVSRAHRSGRVSQPEFMVARQALRQRWNDLTLIELSPQAVNLAVELTEWLALRTLDALHLSTAVTLGEGVTMATADRELKDAALALGIPVIGFEQA
jgi:predicted nucleic acid-binding protein